MSSTLHIRNLGFYFDLKSPQIFLAGMLGLGLLFCVSGCSGERRGDTLQERMLEARDLIRVSDFAAASDLLEAHPPSEITPSEQIMEWQYLAGITAWHRVPPGSEWQQLAIQHLEGLVEEFPTHPKAAQAAYTLGRIYEVFDFQGDPVDLEKARYWYQRTYQEWPDTNAAHTALFREAALSINQFSDPEEVIKGCELLSEWLEQNPDNELAPVAAVFLAESYDRILNDPQQALRFYMLAEELGWVSQVQTGVQRWRAAEVAESLGKWDEAIAFYQKIIQENIQSGLGSVSSDKLHAIQEKFPQRDIIIPPINQTSRMGEIE